MRAGGARLPAGLRWTCSGCGACCTGYELGPVEPELVERWREAGLLDRGPAAEHGAVDERGHLRTLDGRCVFLTDDRRCAVHAALGPEAKPGFCREFPFQLVEDPLGLVAVVRASCLGFGRTSQEGPLVRPVDVAEVQAAGRTPRRFAPKEVPVVPGMVLPLDRYMALEQQLVATVEQAPEVGPAGLVARVRDRILPWGPPPNPGQARVAEEAVLRALRVLLEHVVEQPGGAPHQRAFARESLDRLRAAHERAGEPLVLDGDAVAFANLLLRSHLLAKRFTAWGGVAEGLGVWLVGATVACRTADAPSAEAVGAAWRAWERFEAIGLVSRWLRKTRPALVDLFLHATEAGPG